MNDELFELYKKYPELKDRMLQDAVIHMYLTQIANGTLTLEQGLVSLICALSHEKEAIMYQLRQTLATKPTVIHMSREGFQELPNANG